MPSASKHTAFSARIFAPAAAVLIAVPAILPMAAADYWAGADALFHLYRFYAWSEAFGRGNLFPRWAPDLYSGLGSPMIGVYAVLPNYAAELFRLVGLSHLLALKLAMAAAVLGSGLTMELFVGSLFGPGAGIAAAATYVYAPYALFDLYQSGALAQTFCLAFVPLVFWTVHRVMKRPSTGRVAAVGASFAAMLLSHQLISYLMMPFLALFCLLYAMQAGSVARAAKAFAVALAGGTLGLGISAIFWVPLLFEQKSFQFQQFLSGSGLDYRQNFVLPAELFSHSILHVYNGALTARYGAAQMGLGQALLVLTSTGLLLGVLFKRRSWRCGFGLLAVVSTGTSLFMITAASLPVWAAIPYGALVEVPIRMLSFVQYFGALAVGAAVGLLPRFRLAAGIAAAVLAGVAGAAGLTNLRYLSMPPAITAADVLAYARLTPGMYTRFYIPRGVDTLVDSSPAVSAIVQDRFGTRWTDGELPAGAKVTTVTSQADDIKLDTQSAKTFPLRVNMVYWDGWKAWINKKETAIHADVATGLITLPVPRGRAQIELRLLDTPLRRIALWLTVVSLSLTLVLLARSTSRWRIRPAGYAAALAMALPLGFIAAAGSLFHPEQGRRDLDINIGSAHITHASMLTKAPDQLVVNVDWDQPPQPSWRITARLVGSGRSWAEARDTTGHHFVLNPPVGMPFDAYFVELDVHDAAGNRVGPIVPRMMYMYPFVEQVQLGSVFLGEANPPLAPEGTPQLRTSAPATAKQGEDVPVDLQWTVDKDMKVNNPAVHLVDHGGTVWAQNDDAFPAVPPPTFWYHGLSFTDRRYLALPPAIPPGKYELHLSYPGQPDKVLRTLQVEALPARQPAAVVASWPNVDLVTATVDPRVRQGSSAVLSLVWHTKDTWRGPEQLLVRLAHEESTVTVPVALGQNWSPGIDAALRQKVEVPATFPGGAAVASVGLPDGAGRVRWHSLQPIDVQPIPRQFSPPAGDLFPADEVFGGVARLASYGLRRQGGQLAIRLVWQALATAPEHYVVFVHAVSASGGIIWQSDQPPGNGQRPTSTWVPGEYVTDEYRFPATNVDHLDIGVYNQVTGQRLMREAGGDHFTVSLGFSARAS